MDRGRTPCDHKSSLQHSAQVSKQEQDAYCYLRLEIKVGVETDTCPKKMLIFPNNH